MSPPPPGGGGFRPDIASGELRSSLRPDWSSEANRRFTAETPITLVQPSPVNRAVALLGFLEFLEFFYSCFRSIGSRSVPIETADNIGGFRHLYINGFWCRVGFFSVYYEYSL